MSGGGVVLRWGRVVVCAGLLALTAGCATWLGGPDEVVDRALTPELRQSIDRTLSFADIRTTPEAFLGRTVMLDGVVLSAKRAAERTEIELLQLPREAGRPPVSDRTLSEGRFLAIHPQFIDPARFEKGLPLTVVGTVAGVERRPLDEGEYRYPVVELKQLVTWDLSESEPDFRSGYAGMRPFASDHHWWGPNRYYFGPFGPYPTHPYTNPAACPFCYYPPGGPYTAPFPR